MSTATFELDGHEVTLETTGNELFITTTHGSVLIKRNDSDQQIRVHDFKGKESIA